MRRFILLAALGMVGAATWYVGTLLSSDALGMTVGLLFGAAAGVPAALLVLFVASRSTDEDGAQ